MVLSVGFIGCSSDMDSSTGPTEGPEGQTSEVETEWRKTFGGGRSYSVKQTVDEEFIVTGSDKNDNGDVFLLKTDSQGNEQWRKTFGDGYGLSVQQTVDGGFIVTGFDDNDDVVFLLKTDKLGNI